MSTVGPSVFAAVREIERAAQGSKRHAIETLGLREELMRRYWITVHTLIAYGRGDLWACGGVRRKEAA